MAMLLSMAVISKWHCTILPNLIKLSSWVYSMIVIIKQIQKTFSMRILCFMLLYQSCTLLITIFTHYIKIYYNGGKSINVLNYKKL
jgi:hypothetical protein